LIIILTVWFPAEKGEKKEEETKKKNDKKKR
jgi:hypothetical protein